MLDGIKVVVKSGFSIKEFEKELFKNVGEESFYLEKDRVYRDENDVFEYYSLEERNVRFGILLVIVYENMKNLEIYVLKLKFLK